MGTWGFEPWENDAAADWFAQMHAQTRLAAYVEKTLALDIVDSYEEIRAAAAMLVAFGREYTWPVESLQDHLALAAHKLQQMLTDDSCPIQESEELMSAVSRELDILKTRLTRSE